MKIEKLDPRSNDLRETERHTQVSLPDFFYSERLKSFISYGPLKICDRVVKVASEVNIKLDWDDEGRISNITYPDARKLMNALGSKLLSPSEYWMVYNEAKTIGNDVRVGALEPSDGTEWLDAVFQRDQNGAVSMIEHPQITSADGQNIFSGDPVVIEQQIGRPGWFNPANNINPETGMPLDIETTREKGSPSWSETTWKYWSTFQIGEPVVGIRGYVTSSGTPSLDLDIPPQAAQTVLFIRERRDALLEPIIDQEILAAATKIIDLYESTIATVPGEMNTVKHEEFYSRRLEILDFVDKYGKDLMALKNKDVLAIREKIIDMLGIIRLEAARKDDLSTGDKIDVFTERLFPQSKEGGSYDRLEAYLKNTRSALEKALEEKRGIVFVMGHKNPDTDTAVSALFEAYRNSLLDMETVYIPVVQAQRLPDEIQRLLGDVLSKAYMLTIEPLYEKAKVSGQARWILVDHNKDEQQKFAISIVDHHILTSTAQRQNVSKTWEMVGSCSGQVAQKLFGMGVIPDTDMARILHGATLMDTENRGPKKMTYRDQLIMDALQKLSLIPDENEFYQDLMSFLLNTDDAQRLFERDYKQDWGIWGFAVAKVKNVFDSQGNSLKPELLQNLIEQAIKNNEAKNFAMTMVKVVDYLDDNETVNRERIYLIFNPTSLPEFRAEMFTLMERIIKFEFGGRAQVKKTADSIEFWGVGDQLSRKVVAPKIEPIVEAFNEYYYSEKTGKYVRREFLKDDPRISETARRLGISFTVDKEGRITNITYHEAKQLLEALGMRMLSMAEYWKVLQEANVVHDEQMQRHLLSRGFVELFDTVILDKHLVIDHPRVQLEAGNVTYIGDMHDEFIPEAYPALIYPEDIDERSGIPLTCYTGPERYSDPNAWRYWSPDAAVVTPTRGHIFLLNKPALDMKIHPDDALPNLGIRPCIDNVPLPAINIAEENGELKVSIIKDAG